VGFFPKYAKNNMEKALFFILEREKNLKQLFFFYAVVMFTTKNLLQRL